MHSVPLLVRLLSFVSKTVRLMEIKCTKNKNEYVYIYGLHFSLQILFQIFLALRNSFIPKNKEFRAELIQPSFLSHRLSVMHILSC
jgi:hypothetical protein